MLTSRNRVGLTILIVTAAILSSSILSEPAAGQDEKQIKNQINSALKNPWMITGFETVASSASGPWSSLRGDYRGYAVTCEDVGRTVAESGGKSDGAGNARRHPRFDLWLLRRTASVTPAKVQQDLQQLSFSALQAVTPKLLGFNQDYVVACMTDCSEKAVTEIARTLKLRNFSGNGDKSR
jgi:hypothetical protein